VAEASAALAEEVEKELKVVDRLEVLRVEVKAAAVGVAAAAVAVAAGTRAFCLASLAGMQARGEVGVSTVRSD